MLSFRKKKTIYDLIVIGAGGLVGSSALRTAAKVGLGKKNFSVLGIDQFNPPHSYGSSHGETRITRVAIGEGDEYVPLAMRSHEIWREIENEMEQKPGTLCNLSGGLIIASEQERGNYHGSQNGFLQQTRACAKKFSVSHQNLTAEEIQATFPQFSLQADEAGYFEQSMGFLRPEKCIQAHLTLAEKYGAALQTGERFLRYEMTESGNVNIFTCNDQGKKNCYQTKKLILAAGAWNPDLLAEHCQNEFKVYRQTVFWFEIAEEWLNKFTVGNFPVFIWDRGNKGVIYGFPTIEGNCLKIASESFAATSHPDTVSRTVSQEEIHDMYERLIKPNLKGILPRCVKSTVCLYTVTPRYRFVIDFVPNSQERVIAVSACSGHGAKHSAAIGEAVAERALLGKSYIDVVSIFPGLKPKTALENKQIMSKL